MLLVSLTPHIMVVSVLFSAFYTTFYLSSGFLIPKPQIPKWWMWSYSLTPASWTMEGLLTSQYGDIDREIQEGRTFSKSESVCRINVSTLYKA
ncbi:hypothetical protein WN944_003181 [Citrus x changshan-huyou]|uniref:ABC-2 type transporter transmembrane domain-containing protein n=1 Tax=Citrus x changshan-huyou TaxID=2935761 RepID=A0AAP0M4A3_9ROSI